MNKVKFVTLAATALIAAGLLTGCGSSNDTSTTDSSAPATTETSTVGSDVTTAATQTDATDVDTLIKGLSADGSWIVHGTHDIDASGKTITVEGDSFPDRTGAMVDKRKLALYTQERDSSTTPPTVTITGSFTLTVDRLIVKSPNFDLSNMTLKGDVYVDAKGFIISTTEGTEHPPSIDGNLIFATQELKDAFMATGNDQFVTGEVKVGTPN
ncbi:MAG: hypothetical protein LBV67_00265 [Streptococcaceae bacterium]|jgi:hypothetical protein|nr:hypothetical protein [Streptococcaceae bacterium]